MKRYFDEAQVAAHEDYFNYGGDEWNNAVPDDYNYAGGDYNYADGGQGHGSARSSP